MENHPDGMCRIPINATFQKINGEMKMVAAEWADIPADAIARFLMQRSGCSLHNNTGTKERQRKT